MAFGPSPDGSNRTTAPRSATVVRAAARRGAELGGGGTNDLLVKDVLRTNEKQAWFVHEQLATNDLHEVEQ